jgi:hypothetical protein
MFACAYSHFFLSLGEVSWSGLLMVESFPRNKGCHYPCGFCNNLFYNILNLGRDSDSGLGARLPFTEPSGSLFYSSIDIYVKTTAHKEVGYFILE